MTNELNPNTLRDLYANSGSDDSFGLWLEGYAIYLQEQIAKREKTIEGMGASVQKAEAKLKLLDAEHQRLCGRVVVASRLLTSSHFDGLTHAEKRGVIQVLLGGLMEMVSFTTEQRVASGDYIPF